MAKHFKTKKKLRHDIIVKYLFILIICYIIIRLCLSLILDTSLLNFVFQHNNLSEYYHYITKKTINNPVLLLQYKPEPRTIEEVSLAHYSANSKPKIYIYNTHQKESYSDSKTVLDAAKQMKIELAKHNIDVIVEERDITEFMQANNISYNYSYYASKFFVKDALSKQQLSLLIDLHRDAVSRNASTVTINNKTYAKIMFVVGTEHDNYKANYALANQLNDLVKKINPSLTRGVLLKNSNNANGIYNQDLSSKSVLIELGGNNNTTEEVNNTITILCKVIRGYIDEQSKNS